MEREARKPNPAVRQAMLESFKRVKLPPANIEALRSSDPDLVMGALCQFAVPLRDGLRAENPALNRSHILQMLKS